MIAKKEQPAGVQRLKKSIHKFEIYMMMYGSAVKEVRTKLEILSDNLSVDYKRNPIEMIKSRIKKPESILEKLHRKGFEITAPHVLENLNDIAGIRVVCSFIDDIYDVAGMLSRQDDITVLEIKDYIKNPKPNAYRSYHMIIEIPVFFADRKQPMKVEVQFRTIAMDFWASLEHQMKYKKNVEHSEEIAQELRNCAETIAKTDLRMQSISKAIFLLDEE